MVGPSEKQVLNRYSRLITFTVYRYGPVEREDDKDGEDDEWDSPNSFEDRGADFQMENECDIIDVDTIDELLQEIEGTRRISQMKTEEETVEIPCEVQKRTKGD